MQSGDTKLEAMMKSHFEDDNIQFAKIENNHQKLMELTEINGNHLSYFNKNLELLNKSHEEIKAVWQRIEPMVLKYETDERFNQQLGIRSKKWTARIIQGGTIVGAITAIWVFIKVILSNIK